MTDLLLPVSRRRDVQLEHLVRSRENLILDDWTDREIAGAVARGTLFRLRRGWYIDGAEREALWPEERHRAHVIAVARDSRGGAVMSHSSAAVLWRLPLYRIHCVRVHMTLLSARRNSSAPDVKRHIGTLEEDDIVTIDGIRCASLGRTVFDLIGTLPLESAVALADAAERQMAERIREWDLDAVESWRRALQARLEASSGMRGLRQMRWVAAFADGRAQLPGESVSRLQLVRLGFAVPKLQVPVAGPDGNSYFVDFGLDDVNCFGEFDGKDKYFDEAMRSGLTIEEVIFAEKRREDWIRGSTHRRFARWESEHILTSRALGLRLEAFGIRAP
ncbi:MAG: hypothetical protein JSS74_07695 [Actinobacteria bacterium]|nr:hypothetical protein [Actinomycetota bacterium]